jgi:hypothetical protein
LAIFVDRANKTTLVENLTEAIAVEKRVVALEKRSAIEERKSKKSLLQGRPQEETNERSFRFGRITKSIKDHVQ